MWTCFFKSPFLSSDPMARHVTEKWCSKVSPSARRKPSGTRSGCLRPFDQVVSFKGDQEDLEINNLPLVKRSSKSYLFIYHTVVFLDEWWCFPSLGTTPHFPKKMEQLVASKELKGVVFLLGATSTTDRLPKYTKRWGVAKGNKRLVNNRFYVDEQELYMKLHYPLYSS